MKKKLLALFLTLVIGLSLVACTAPAANDNSTDVNDNSQTEQDVEPVVDPLIDMVVEKPADPFTGYRHIVYYTDWSVYGRDSAPGDIDPTLLTHINIAFAKPTPSGAIELLDPEADINKDFGDRTIGTNPDNNLGVFGQLRALRETNPDLQLLISVGGWSLSEHFSDIAADPTKRDTFAQSCADFVEKHDLDGVDIDWEYPVEGGDTDVKHRPEDKQNCTMLMKATRKALNELGEKTGKRYTLSIAGYAGTNFVNTVEPVELMKYLDFINIMTYDYHGAWDEYAAFNAPMYANENDPTPMAAQCITASVKSYVDAGFPADKIVLGAPFYGRGFVVESADNNGTFQKGKAPAGTGKGKGTWEAAVFDCWEVEEKYLGEWGFTRYWDDVAKCPVAFDGELWICYEDAESIKVKTDYIKEENLGGIMFWEFFGDKYKTLQTVAAEELSINK